MKFFKKKQKVPFKKQFQMLWRPFVIIFCIGFVITNWNSIFWIFNYRVISAQINSALPEQQDITVDDILSAVWNGQKPEPKYVENANSIVISKIGITAPIVFVPQQTQNVQMAVLKKYLDRGVLHYPGTSLPGEKGQVVILGHSAPAGWPRIKYDWVFSKLDKLKKGDNIVVYYNNREYSYRVRKTIFLEKGEELPDSALTKSRYMLVLISCWPPGKDSKRIAVEAIMR